MANGKSDIIDKLVDMEVPEEARLSPSGRHVAYATKPAGKKGEHVTSTLWIAQAGKAHSAKQLLKSESYNDRSPQWNLSGKTIAFLSDRGGRGEACAIYEISVNGADDPKPLTKLDNKQSITQFRWSPDGSMIAYLSPDEKTAEEKDKEEAKDDVKVYGEKWEYNRLRVLNINTKTIFTAYDRDAHVKELAWCDNSEEIYVLTHRIPDINSPTLHGTDISIVSVNDESRYEHLHHLIGPASSLHVFEDKLYFAAGFTPQYSETSATALYVATRENCTRLYYGNNNDLESLGGHRGLFVTKVLSGLSDELNVTHLPFGLSIKEEIAKNSWDVAKTATGSCTLAFVKSSASSPREVYTLEVSGQDDATGDPVQLSNHSDGTLTYFENVDTTFIQCPSEDGKVNLDLLYHAPTSASTSRNGPWPTIVLLHGGPYYRWTDRFDSPFPLWQPAILSTGKFGVLVPNYRGGSSRGENFAAAARGGVGTVEYDDVLTAVDEGIKRGLVDKDRIVVGGWSQGGFLSYLCAVRNGFDRERRPKAWSFKGAIPGAGVTDWDTICMTNDCPTLEGELCGGVPWESLNKHDTSTRRASAIWEMAGAQKNIPPLLILHGEADERVPVSQAISFHRGCLHYRLPCEMAIYPREPHMFGERAHMIDMLKRVLKFCDARLG